MTRILIGTCNWLDHKGFYPPELDKSSRSKERLTYYAEHFPIVEVDTTFYGIPKPDVAIQWIDRTPDAFVFNVKAYRTLTGHGTREEPRRDASDDEWADFLGLLEPLRDSGKLGAVHYQFAPWIKHSVANRERLLEIRDHHPDDRIAIEFRHMSWYEPESLSQTVGLMRELDMTLVSVDAPNLGTATAPPGLYLTSPELAVVRFHGRNYKTWYRKGGTSAERFDYEYTEADFAQWADSIRAAEGQVAEMHLLMNTNAGNQGPNNARTLAGMLGVELPYVAFTRAPDLPDTGSLPSRPG